MGYYTRYNVSDNSSEIQKAIEELSQYSFYYGRTDEVKWYNWEADCKQISLKFPNTVINVEGVGEEDGDHWKAYVKDGKIQIVKAKVTFDSYDESKLK